VRPTGITRIIVTASTAVCGCWVSASAAQPATPDIATLLTRVGQRVVDYYHRAQSLMCVEKAMVQPIDSNWSSQGLSRSVESELRVESEAADGEQLPDARIVRAIRRINGRAPRESDKTDRNACTDPNPLSPEPLAFLLPSHRDRYQFTAVREGKEKDVAVFMLDFVSTDRKSKLELIEDEGGHDDCFDWRGPIATRGRVWVDAQTFEVIRVDERIDGPIDVHVSWPLQRRHLLPQWLVLERNDQTIRYKPVTFSNPDEVMLLPESIESLVVMRGGLQSTRRSQRFSEYRRFLTGSRIINARGKNP
jgi:hypothetical protein